MRFPARRSQWATMDKRKKEVAGIGLQITPLLRRRLRLRLRPTVQGVNDAEIAQGHNTA